MEKKGQDKIWELSAGKIFNELDPEEEKDFVQLMGESENRKIFTKTKQIHNGLKSTRTLQDVSPALSWGKISKHINTSKIQFFKSVLKYAAIIIFAFAAGTLIKDNMELKQEPLVYAELKVPLGQMSEITLYDGTQVWLNSGSTLKYPNNFGKGNRDVYLNGEAFFKVRHNDIPFKVKLKKSEVEVLGTSFNIVSYEGESSSQVTLIEGSVQINCLSGKEMAKISPAEQITIPDDLKKINTKKVDTGFYSSWTEGRIEFEEERLTDIASRLERWYNVEINFTSSEAEGLRFSGTILKNKPFDQIIKAIGLLLPVEITYMNKLGEKDTVTISKINKPM